MNLAFLCFLYSSFYLSVSLSPNVIGACDFTDFNMFICIYIYIFFSFSIFYKRVFLSYQGENIGNLIQLIMDFFSYVVYVANTFLFFYFFYLFIFYDIILSLMDHVLAISFISSKSYFRSSNLGTLSKIVVLKKIKQNKQKKCA